MGVSVMTAAEVDTENMSLGDYAVMFASVGIGALPGIAINRIKYPFRYIYLPDGRTVRAEDDDCMLELRQSIRRARGTALHVLPMRDGTGLGVSFTF